MKSTVDPIQLKRIQRQQFMRQAEGYLELMIAFDDRWPLEQELREMLSERAIHSLTRIEEPKGHLGYILFLKGQACKACSRSKKRSPTSCNPSNWTQSTSTLIWRWRGATNELASSR